MEIDKTIEKMLEKEIESLTKELKSVANSKMQSIKLDIYASFRVIVTTKMQEVFFGAYGNNFENSVLENSLTFIPKNGLRPDFSYDYNLFYFNDTLASDTDKFNPNEYVEKSVCNFSEDPIFDSQELEDKYDITTNSIDEFNLEFDESKKFDKKVAYTYLNKANRQGAFASVEETYLKARNEALMEFGKQYVSQIKPKILKKYGIKLG